MTDSQDPVDKPPLLHREESTTPDLFERESRLLEAANRRGLDAALGLYAPDAALENADGLGPLEGKAAIRHFWQDWLASYGELWVERKEVLHLGHGLVFSVLLRRGRPVGSGGRFDSGPEASPSGRRA